jgi:hypothetical protein
MDSQTLAKVKHSVQVLTTILMEVLRNVEGRRQSVVNFQKEVWNLHEPSENFPELRILRDLALSLDYYEPDPVIRQEDSSYYGDERLEIEIGAAVRKLTEGGGK